MTSEWLICNFCLSFVIFLCPNSGLVIHVFSRQTSFFECEDPIIDGHNRARCRKRTGYILATCCACPTKLLLDWCRVFLEYAKIEQAKESITWQGGKGTERITTKIVKYEPSIVFSPPGVWEVIGSNPVLDSDFFLCPTLVTWWSFHFHIFSPGLKFSTIFNSFTTKISSRTPRNAR